jgi:hypothetical protein
VPRLDRVVQARLLIGCWLVFDFSLESIAFDFSYGDQRTICGRSTAPRYPACRDKNTLTLVGFFYTHFACALAFLGVMTSRRNGLRI